MRERPSAIKPVKQPQPKEHDGDVSPFSVSKLLNPDADWDREQLGDVLHWIRQALGLLLGIIWGAIPVTGAFWLILFFIITSGVIYAYYHLILKVDEEEFGGHGSLLQEGLFASFTLFLVSGDTSSYFDMTSWTKDNLVVYVLAVIVDCTLMVWSWLGFWSTAFFIFDDLQFSCNP